MSTLKQLVDETTNIKNNIVNCNNVLREKLTSKGVNFENSDKHLTLINKIDAIEIKKFGANYFKLVNEFPALGNVRPPVDASHTLSEDIDVIYVECVNTRAMTSVGSITVSILINNIQKDSYYIQCSEWSVDMTYRFCFAAKKNDVITIRVTSSNGGNINRHSCKLYYGYCKEEQ